MNTIMISPALLFKTYCLGSEIKKTTNKIARLSYHAPRCSKVEDKIKLLLIIAVESSKLAYFNDELLKIKTNN